MNRLMKSLSRSLLIIATLVVSSCAAPTDTLKYVRPKVVELHITHKPKPEVALSSRKARIVDMGHSVCSGSFVTSHGDILTARHCATDIQSIDVLLSDGRQYEASIVALSDRHDLALIHIDATNTPHFKLGKLPEQGQTVYTYGSPLGITGTLAKGIVAKLAGDVNYVDLSVLPGNSGGPLFNEDGDLVGVTTAGFVVLYGMTHLNIVQSVEAIYFFALQVTRDEN